MEPPAKASFGYAVTYASMTMRHLSMLCLSVKRSLFALFLTPTFLMAWQANIVMPTLVNLPY